jgi:FkbM family methyltransferase
MNKMSRRIFLDVGSNIGQTIEEAIKPEHNFDLVFAFEPMQDCCDIINQNYISDRLVVNNFGLYSSDCDKTLYINHPSVYDGNLDIGGSIFSDKVDRVSNPSKRADKVCQFKDVAKWFKDNINEGDYVIVKINAEGSECDIVERLVESGEYDKITRLLIDFDCQKVPSQQHRENEIKNLLNSLNKTNYIGYFPQGNTHADRIKNFINKVNC